MKIVCISDTHCQLSDITIPDGDLLVHCGDLTYRGDIQEVAKEAKQFNKLLKKFTYGAIFTPGNHDWGFERNEQLFREMMGDVKVLIHESIIINGLNFFASPYTPEFCSWAYNIPRDKLKPYWDAIPENTNVLITHGPAKGILDKCPDGFLAGCEELLKRTQALPNLSHHIAGHIHEGYGTSKVGAVTYVNASVCTGDYKPRNKPLEIIL